MVKEEINQLKDGARSNSEDMNKHLDNIQSMLDDIKARTLEAKCQLEVKVAEERTKQGVRKAIPVKTLAANSNVRKANQGDQSRNLLVQPPVSDQNLSKKNTYLTKGRTSATKSESSVTVKKQRMTPSRSAQKLSNESFLRKTTHTES